MFISKASQTTTLPQAIRDPSSNAREVGASIDSRLVRLESSDHLSSPRGYGLELVVVVFNTGHLDLDTLALAHCLDDLASLGGSVER